jgi:hypothetical protein
MRYLSLLLAALIAACVPAAGPTPAGPSALAKAEAVAQAGGYAGAFPEPLAGWSAGAPEERAGIEDGGTTLQRAYTNAAGGVLHVVWYLDSPRTAAAVRAVAPPNATGPSVATAIRSQTMETAVDARTVLMLTGAGLPAQFTYFAAMRKTAAVQGP